MKPTVCLVTECGGRPKGRGLCPKHYVRWRRSTPPGDRRPATAIERFWRHVERSAGCWLWTAGCQSNGYGTFQVAVGDRRLAHRYSWSVHHGEIPAGLNVLHRCDTPACVRPDHLFLGTQKDNVADMRAKGRGANQHGRFGVAEFHGSVVG